MKTTTPKPLPQTKIRKQFENYSQKGRRRTKNESKRFPVQVSLPLCLGVKVAILLFLGPSNKKYHRAVTIGVCKRSVWAYTLQET